MISPTAALVANSVRVWLMISQQRIISRNLANLIPLGIVSGTMPSAVIAIATERMSGGRPPRVWSEKTVHL